jgi:ketosteroid isomerase-like protein
MRSSGRRSTSRATPLCRRLEHTSPCVDGQRRTYTRRATQVYRREDGEWKVAHRHFDTVTD